MTALLSVPVVPVGAVECAAALPFPGEDPAALEVSASRLRTGARHLERLTDEIFDARNALTRAWLGTTGRLGDAELGRMRTALDDAVGRLHAARGALLAAADRLAAIRADVTRLRSDWCRAEGQLRGVVLATQAADPLTLAALHELHRSATDRRNSIETRFANAVARADAVTAECAAALTASVSGPPVYRTGRGLVAPDLGAALGTDQLVSDNLFRSDVPGAADDEARWAALGATAQQFALITAGSLPTGGDPAARAAWWRSRTWTERQAVLHADPRGVGAADGLPAEARNQANLLHLERRAQELDSALAAGDPLLAGVALGLAGPIGGEFDRRLALAVVEHERWAIETVRLQLAAPRSQPIYLLAVDLAAHGQAVVAIGNPDTADHVATYVPGTGTDVEGLGGELERADRWGAGTAEFLNPRVATIAWLGYEAPPHVGSAAFDSYADAAAPALVAFQRGLRASHQGRASQNTVVAHSYGALVVAAAASGGRSLAADRLVLVGSTGLEIDSVRHLHLDGVSPEEMSGRVLAIRRENDAIRHTSAVHSESPYDADFGATVKITTPVEIKIPGSGLSGWAMDAGLRMGSQVVAHSAYSVPGSYEQRLVSAFIVGAPAPQPR